MFNLVSFSPEVPITSSSVDNKPLDEPQVSLPDAKEPPIELIPDIMPVEEAAEHLELPAQTEDKTRNKSGDNAFYFYQGT